MSLLFALLLFSTVALAMPQQTPTVFIEKVKDQSVFQTLTYPAQVESKVNSSVLAEADGVVSKVLKSLGAKVRAGQTLAIIRHIDPVFQYAPLRVLAPVDGVVSQVYLTEGSLVNKGDKIETLTDPKHLRIMIEVAAQDIHLIHAGLNGQFSGAGQDTSVEIVVKGLSPSVDPVLGTASCELAIANKTQAHLLSPGFVGRVAFKVNEHQGILLPDYAIIYRGEKTFVHLIDAKGVAHRIPVKVGMTNQGEVEVLSGLHVGDQIVDRASGYVADGQKVQVQSAND